MHGDCAKKEQAQGSALGGVGGQGTFFSATNAHFRPDSLSQDLAGGVAATHTAAGKHNVPTSSKRWRLTGGVGLRAAEHEPGVDRIGHSVLPCRRSQHLGSPPAVAFVVAFGPSVFLITSPRPRHRVIERYLKTAKTRIQPANYRVRTQPSGSCFPGYLCTGAPVYRNGRRSRKAQQQREAGAPWRSSCWQGKLFALERRLPVSCNAAPNTSRHCSRRSF